MFFEDFIVHWTHGGGGVRPEGAELPRCSQRPSLSCELANSFWAESEALIVGDECSVHQFLFRARGMPQYLCTHPGTRCTSWARRPRALPQSLELRCGGGFSLARHMG